MLEKRVKVLLQLIDDNVGTSYKILTRAELLDMLCSQMDSTVEQMDSAINYLMQKEYITVKYNDSTDICLASTTKARAQLEHSKSNIQRASIPKWQFWTMLGIVVLGSFVGSLLADIIQSIF